MSEAYDQTGRYAMTAAQRRAAQDDANERGISHNEMMKEIRDRQRVGKTQPQIRAGQNVKVHGDLVAVPEAGKAANALDQPVLLEDIYVVINGTAYYVNLHTDGRLDLV